MVTSPEQMTAMAGGEPAQKVLQRGVPDQPHERVEFIEKWHKCIREARDKRFEAVFKQMREDMQFARGKQWSENERDERYRCNLVQRHIQKRTAALYAKNPRAISRLRNRLEYRYWDGSQEALMMAQQMPEDPVMQAILQDFHEGTLRKKQFERIGKTLESLFAYYLDEDIPPFKLQIKQLVRRVITTGVGYLKLDFQRVTEQSADYYKAVQDHMAKLNEASRIAADMADGELETDSPEAENLRLLIENLQKQHEIIVNEGLVFRFPHSTSIIPAPDCYQLKGFLGASWVAQEYYFTKDQVKEIWKIDLGTDYTGYSKDHKTQPMAGMAGPGDDKGLACVWELYDLSSGMRLYLADGYKDLLDDNTNAPLTFEQGHPFFVLSFNDLEDEQNIFPPSDVYLLRDQQKEYNRSREALREHRIANKPGWISPKGMWDENDLQKIGNHVAHELMQLNIPITPNLDINKLLIAKPTVPIDPNLYDVEYVFTDVLRGIGDHEATFGGSSGDTATEVAVAETSRVSSIESNTDDLDDFLTQVARASGSILLTNMGREQVEKIVGPGAIWPQFSAQEAADEVFLEIQAGSSGRPNKSQELANAERIMPTLIQIPGINPRWLAEQLLNRMDDKLDLSDAFAEGMPSIIAMNAMSKGAGAGAGAGAGQGGQPGESEDRGGSNEQRPQGQPAAQGPQGGNNAEQPNQSAPGGQPAFPMAQPGGPMQ